MGNSHAKPSRESTHVDLGDVLRVLRAAQHDSAADYLAGYWDGVWNEHERAAVEQKEEAGDE